jgi:hypothetical protein
MASAASTASATLTSSPKLPAGAHAASWKGEEEGGSSDDCSDATGSEEAAAPRRRSARPRDAPHDRQRTGGNARRKSARAHPPPARSRGRRRAEPEYEAADDDEDEYGSDDDEEAEDGDPGFSHAAFDNARAVEAEAQEEEEGLGIAAAMGLDVAVLSGGILTMDRRQGFDAWCRYMVAVLCTPDAARGVLHDTPACADARLWQAARRSVERSLCGARDSLAGSTAWRPDVRSALGCLPFLEAFQESEHASAAGADGLGGDCTVCGRSGHPATWFVKLTGPAVDVALLYGEEAAAVGGGTCGSGSARGQLTLTVRGSDSSASGSNKNRGHRASTAGLGSPCSTEARSSGGNYWGDGLLLGRHAVYEVEFPAGRFCRQRLELYSALLHFKYRLALLLSDVVRRWLASLAPGDGDAAVVVVDSDAEDGSSNCGGDGSDGMDDEDEGAYEDEEEDGGAAAGAGDSSAAAGWRGWRRRHRGLGNSQELLGEWPVEPQAQMKKRLAAERKWLQESGDDADVDSGSDRAKASGRAAAAGAGQRSRRVGSALKQRRSLAVDDDDDDDSEAGSSADGPEGNEAGRGSSAGVLTAFDALDALRPGRFVRSLPHSGTLGPCMVHWQGSGRQRHREALLRGRADFLREALAQQQANESRYLAQMQPFSASKPVAVPSARGGLPARIRDASSHSSGAGRNSAARDAGTGGSHGPQDDPLRAALQFAGDEMPDARPLPQPPDWEAHVLPLFESALWAREVGDLQRCHAALIDTAQRLFSTSAPSSERHEIDLGGNWAHILSAVGRDQRSSRMLRFAWQLRAVKAKSYGAAAPAAGGGGPSRRASGRAKGGKGGSARPESSEGEGDEDEGDEDEGDEDEEGDENEEGDEEVDGAEEEAGEEAELEGALVEKRGVESAAVAAEQREISRARHRYEDTVQTHRGYGEVGSMPEQQQHEGRTPHGASSAGGNTDRIRRSRARAARGADISSGDTDGDAVFDTEFLLHSHQKQRKPDVSWVPDSATRERTRESACKSEPAAGADAASSPDGAGEGSSRGRAARSGSSAGEAPPRTSPPPAKWAKWSVHAKAAGAGGEAEVDVLPSGSSGAHAPAAGGRSGSAAAPSLMSLRALGGGTAIYVHPSVSATITLHAALTPGAGKAGPTGAQGHTITLVSQQPAVQSCSDDDEEGGISLAELRMRAAAEARSATGR